MTDLYLKNHVSKYKTKIANGEYVWYEIVSLFSIPLYFTLKKYFTDPYKFCAQGFGKTFIQQHYSQLDGSRSTSGSISEFGSLVIKEFGSLDYSASSSKTEVLKDISRIIYVYNHYDNPIILYYFSQLKKTGGLRLAIRNTEAQITDLDNKAAQNFRGMITLLETFTTNEFASLLTRMHDESLELMLNSGIVHSLKEIRVF